MLHAEFTISFNAQLVCLPLLEHHVHGAGPVPVLNLRVLLLGIGRAIQDDENVVGILPMLVDIRVLLKLLVSH